LNKFKYFEIWWNNFNGPSSLSRLLMNLYTMQRQISAMLELFKIVCIGLNYELQVKLLKEEVITLSLFLKIKFTFMED